MPSILAAFIAVGAASISVGGPETAAADVVKVRASDHQGRVLKFRPRGVEPDAVEKASVRRGSRARKVGLAKARAGVERGTVKVAVSKRDLRGILTARLSSRERKLKKWVLVLETDSGTTTVPSEPTPEPTPDPTPEPTPEPTPDESHILISAERLASLPTSGAAWTYMKQQADFARTGLDLDSTPSSASPWLPNYNGTGDVRRPATQTLAMALVYARTGDSAYRDKVIAALRYVIGSENSGSTDGTAANDRALATARSIGAYVLAADLVGMDPATTGSRSGYTGTRWNQWLSALRTKTIGEPANCNSLAQCSNERGHNWGAFATAARIAIDIHLGDSTDLAAVVSRYKRFLGESLSGSQWKPSSALDLSYACIPSGTTWVAINPAGCGSAKDGMIVEDISRSAGSFLLSATGLGYDKTGIGYTMESYQALLLSAVMLERKGYDPFAWGDQALLRVMQWLEREGKEQGNGSSVELHQSWIANHFYGEDFKTVAANMGRSLGFTDWLFAG